MFFQSCWINLDIKLTFRELQLSWFGSRFLFGLQKSCSNGAFVLWVELNKRKQWQLFTMQTNIFIVDHISSLVSIIYSVSILLLVLNACLFHIWWSVLYLSYFIILYTWLFSRVLETTVILSALSLRYCVILSAPWHRYCSSCPIKTASWSW